MSTPTPNAWAQQPPPPKKKGKVKWFVLGAAALLVVIIIAVAASVGGSSSTDTTKPDTSTSQPAHDQGGQAGDSGEVDDVQSFKFDDRSQAGISNVWATYKITNDSSKTSNYEVDYSVIDDATGNRVEHSSVFENAVKPGQTVTGSTPLTVDHTAGYTIKVTHVQRMEAVQ